LAALQVAGDSAEHVLRPPATTPRFADEDALKSAYDDGRLVALPDRPAATGLRPLRSLRPVFRGLRPEALALALYVGAETRAASGDPRSALTISSTVRDQAYQRLLVRSNPEATRNYSLHTTGWAFDVLRRYRSKRQALAFQFVLDRLQVLNVLAWTRTGRTIHITASPDAGRLQPLLDRVNK
jgi:hypothetical protein